MGGGGGVGGGWVGVGVCVCVFGKGEEREGGRDRQRERERQADRHMKTTSHRQTDKEIERMSYYSPCYLCIYPIGYCYNSFADDTQTHADKVQVGNITQNNKEAQNYTGVKIYTRTQTSRYEVVFPY